MALKPTDGDAGLAKPACGVHPLSNLLEGRGWIYWLTPAIPLAVIFAWVLQLGDTTIFVTSVLGVIPAAALMGRATEELAERSGPGIGGLMNVTFGNLPELLIGFFALTAGLQEVVKAWVIGSIFANALLVLGLSMFVGGLVNRRQDFAAKPAQAQATMLVLASAALIMPSILHVMQGGQLPEPGFLPPISGTVETLSVAVAMVLLVTYGAALLFSLKTHRDLFNPASETGQRMGPQPWSARKAMLALAGAAVVVGVMAEILVESIEPFAADVGLSQFFVGIIVVAVVGNAAEHWVAVYVAYKDKMSLASNIAIGSAAQVALFVGPLLVVLSVFFGPDRLALVFNGYELAAVLLGAFIASYIAGSGQSTWFEGLMLVSVYLVFAVTFLFA